jgi:probable phosphoglycerate mutase
MYLVRHGQSEWNLRRRTQGQVRHPALTARGRAEAERAAGVIANDLRQRAEPSPPTMHSSDLVRAVQTAAIIGARLEVSPQLDPRLREQSLGQLEGRSSDEAIAAAADFDFCDVDAALGGGESARAVYDRMTAVLERLPAERASIVVSHGDALRYACGWVGGKPVEECGWVGLAPGAVVAVEPGGPARRL